MQQHKILFISDVHLSYAYPDRAERFVGFLDSAASGCSALYILGDLFDFWIGPDHLKLDEHKNTLARLRQFSSKVPVFFIPGNRDFYADKNLQRLSGMKMLAEDHALVLNGKKILLTHGDTISTYNKLYPPFRRFTRTNLGFGLYNKLPVKWKYNLAQKARKISVKINYEKATPVRKTGILREAVEKLFKRGYDIIICGHIHRAAVFKLDASHTVFTLGYWDKSQPYLEYSNGAFKTHFGCTSGLR